MAGEREERRWGRRAVLALVVAVLACGAPESAFASVVKCQRTIVAEVGKLVVARAGLLRKCHEAVVKGKKAGPCPDQATTAKLLAAEGKLRTKVNRACGGGDGNCGIGGDDESLAAMGWDAGMCPGFVGGGCDHPIAHCNDVVDCVQSASEVFVSAGRLAPAPWPCYAARSRRERSMSKTTMTKAEREAFLAETRVGVFSVAEPGRGPLVIPVWFHYEPGGVVRFTTGGGSKKAGLMRANGRASLLVQTEAPPYKYASVEGSVRIVGAPDYERDVRAMAVRYLGQEMGEMYLVSLASEYQDVVLVELVPERWLTVDYAKAFG